MERHQRSDKHNYRPTNNATINNSRRRRHRRSPPQEEQSKDRGEEITRSQRKQTDGQQAVEAPPLCEDESYIHRWLARAENEINSSLKRDAGRGRQRASGNENQATQHDSRLQHTMCSHEELALPQERKRKRHSSTDSSLLEEYFQRRPLLTRQEPQESIALMNQHAFTDTSRRTRDDRLQAKSDSSRGSSSNHHRKETFERRKRHKTREDRYESKKIDKEDSKKHQKQRFRREKKGDRKKAIRKDGEELMQNFNSKHISKDRLTIRPTSGLGLFKNGRASSPAQRRGLPDLSFSEMEFLQHPPRQKLVEKDNRGKSKWRETERQKFSRARKEVSEFFKPTQLPQEDKVHREGLESLLSSQDERQFCRRRDIQQENLTNYRRSTSIEPPHKSTLGLIRSRPSTNQPESSRSRTPLREDISHVLYSRNKDSGRATSYVSWSETEGSPITKFTRTRNFHAQDQSPLPVSVRNLVKESKPNKDVGLEKRFVVGNDTSMHRDIIHESLAPTTDSSRFTTTPTSNLSEHYVKQRDLQHDKENDALKLDHRPIENGSIAQHEGLLPEYRKDGNGERAPRSRKRIVVEHFDPVRGWQEKPAAEEFEVGAPALAPDIDVPREVKSVPIDRQGIAKIARIKLPSTSLPIISAEEDLSRLTHGQTRYDGRQALDAASTNQTNVVARGTEQEQAGQLLKPQANKDDPPTEQVFQDPLLNVAGNLERSSKPALETRGIDEHTARSQGATLNVDIGEGAYPRAQDLIRLGLLKRRPMELISQPSQLGLRVDPPSFFLQQLQHEPVAFNHSNHEELQISAPETKENIYPLLEEALSADDDDSYIYLEGEVGILGAAGGKYAEHSLSPTCDEQAMMENCNYVVINGAWEPDMHAMHEHPTNDEYYDEQVLGVVQETSYDHVQTYAPYEQHYDSGLYAINEEDEQLEGFWRPHQQYH